MKKQTKQFVGYLRSHSVETRKQILMFAMIGVVVVLVLIWVATLSTSTPEPESQPVVTEQDVRPFELLKNNFVSSYESVSSGIRGLKSDISGSEETTVTENQPPAEPIMVTGDASSSMQAQ